MGAVFNAAVAIIGWLALAWAVAAVMVIIFSIFDKGD